MPTIEELTARFQADRFATEAAGIVIREAEPGRALCAMKLRPCHMNANNVPMGGAVFTLADFAYAVASNGFTDKISVTQHVSTPSCLPQRGRSCWRRPGP